LTLPHLLLAHPTDYANAVCTTRAPFVAVARVALAWRITCGRSIILTFVCYILQLWLQRNVLPLVLPFWFIYYGWFGFTVCCGWFTRFSLPAVARPHRYAPAAPFTPRYQLPSRFVTVARTTYAPHRIFTFACLHTFTHALRYCCLPFGTFRLTLYGPVTFLRRCILFRLLYPPRSHSPSTRIYRQDRRLRSHATAWRFLCSRTRVRCARTLRARTHAPRTRAAAHPPTTFPGLAPRAGGVVSYCARWFAYARRCGTERSHAICTTTFGYLVAFTGRGCCRDYLTFAFTLRCVLHWF